MLHHNNKMLHHHHYLTSGDLALMHKAIQCGIRMVFRMVVVVVVDISSGDLELMHKTIKDGAHGNMGHTVLTHNTIHQCGIHTSSGVILLDRMRELASKTCTALINKASVEET